MNRPPRALARRYARALLDVASGEGRAAERRIKVDLRSLAALVEDHRELRAALEDPRVSPASRRGVLETIADRLGASATTRRLLALLVERDRVLLLPAIVEAYGEELNARRGIVSAEATGAVALSREQQRSLTEALARASGLEVELRARVDPEVLGGLRVKMGGQTYDGTVRAQLGALRRCLASGR